ncbi:hypothetical protein F5Y01DRAFT_102188 [Xylaria sp. FL0043]|nr:hypothetical protein F5Y01DRAFT_102188 [Xylaria sp. FL0043]
MGLLDSLGFEGHERSQPLKKDCGRFQTVKRKRRILIQCAAKESYYFFASGLLLLLLLSIPLTLYYIHTLAFDTFDIPDTADIYIYLLPLSLYAGEVLLLRVK